MRFWLAAISFGLLVSLAGATAAANAPATQIPVTTNKVEGPVKGQLSDPIDLNVQSPSYQPQVNNKGELAVSFCTHMYYYNGFWSLRASCASPDRQLHLAGRRQLTGITMTPEVEGEWRWSSDYTLVFTPKNIWTPAQDYKVKFDPSIFSENVRLADGNYHFSAEPLRPRISDMAFLQDTNDAEKRGVNTTITFNTPVDAQALKDHLKFTLEEVSDDTNPAQRKIIAKAENMPFDLKLNDDGTEATVTTDIKILPDKERFLKAEIQPGLTAIAGGKPLVAGKPGDFDQRVRIPSRYDYARIDRIQLNMIKNEHYVPEQILIVQSNVPFTNDELTKHLKIYQLPADKPSEVKDGNPIRKYEWYSAAEITDDMLAKAPEVKFTPNPTADAASTIHSIKLDTDPGRWLYVRVSKGLTTKGDYILADDHNDTVKAPAYSKEVKIISGGALLSLSGDKKISVYSLGAQKLHYDIERVMNDDINNLVSQTGGNFENPTFLNYNFSSHNIAEHFDQDIPVSSKEMRKPQFSAFDFSPYLSKTSVDKKIDYSSDPMGRGLFFVTVQAMATDENGKETVVSTDHRFVLVSNLGFVVKTSANGAHDVFVQSIKSGNSVSGAKVEVLGLNGLPVATVETDSKGHAVIPNLQGLTDDKQPTAYVVQDGDDLAFMSYNAFDRRVNYSQFNTDGLENSANGLHAYMFSDRGIYRPGEEGHIGLVIKQGDWATDLSGVPLKLEVTNPRGQVVDKPIIKLDAQGLAEYRFATQDTSPTGVYNFRLYIEKEDEKNDEDGDEPHRHKRHHGRVARQEVEETQLGSTSVRVEEFLPDTLKITSVFNKPNPKGWLSPLGLKATVDLQHLYGAPAVDHRVKATLNVAPDSFAFKEYPDYQFFDPQKPAKDFDQPVGEAQTNTEGKAEFTLNLAQFGTSTYRLTFQGEGFAQDSGRSVRTENSVLVSSLPYVVGMKAEGNLGYLNKSEKRSVQLIAVNNDLMPVDVLDMKFKLVQVDYISTLIKNERGAYEYSSVPKETIISTGDMPIAAKGTSFTLDSAKPGTYALLLTDAKNTVLQRIDYTVAGEGNLLGHARKNAAISVKLDKKKYDTEDTIKLNIVSPYTGTGLITLETDKVLAFKWFKAETTSTIQSIDIPKGFTGKGYVNVQFVRSLDSKEVFTTPFAYHVEPFFVKTDSIDSQIALTLPETAKPGDVLTISYKTKTPGKIIIYGIDEGILQYAHYQTPDPLNYFVNRRALGVETSQILDLLMPEYSVLQSLSATGGGGGEDLGGKGLNPFKRKSIPPVVFWSGIIDADSSEREYHYTVPDYFNGNLRIMAVAVSDQNIGATENKEYVKGDIIISPNVPTFAAPGDEFTIGMSLANNIAGSGKDAKIKLTVVPSEHLDVIEGKDSEIFVPENGEAKAHIRVKAKDILGGAMLTFTASSGKSTAKIDETLSVRPPVPSMTALLSGYVEKGEKVIKQDRDLYKEFAKADSSVSTLPVSLIPGLAQYLDSFPYGCTEQTVSKAFPAVILAGQKDLGGDVSAVQDSVNITMRHLREVQNNKGGFGYWWYGGTADDFVTVYALHYMLIAKEKHLPIPDETFRKAQEYVREMVNQSPSSLEQARNEAYGIYILTRSGVVTANYLPNLLQYLNTQQKDNWKNDLTAVYVAATYRLMKLEPEATQLMNDFTLGEPAYWDAHHFFFDEYRFYNSLNRYSQYLALMSDHFPEMLPKMDRNILFRIANFIGEGDYNTLSSSYAIMGLSAYGQASMGLTKSSLAISQQDDHGAWKPLMLTGEQIKRAELALSRSDVKFSGGGDIGLFYQLATDGYDRVNATQPIEDGLEIKRDFLDTDHKPIKEVKIGDLINVVVTMRAHDNKTLENMAMVDLLPSGFETVPESITPPVAANDNSDNDEDQNAQKSSVNKNNDVYDAPLWSPEAIDAREDRVIAFGEIPSADVIYHYKIKAVNAGTFTVPPAYVESMYDRSVKARGVAGMITVH